jgi:hypothetical protein
MFLNRMNVFLTPCSYFLSVSFNCLSDMCSNFEEISHLRNAVPQILPSSMCGDLAEMCQSLAQALAETADLEVLQRNIKGEWILKRFE